MIQTKSIRAQREQQGDVGSAGPHKATQFFRAIIDCALATQREWYIVNDQNLLEQSKGSSQKDWRAQIFFGENQGCFRQVHTHPWLTWELICTLRDVSKECAKLYYTFERKLALASSVYTCTIDFYTRWARGLSTRGTLSTPFWHLVENIGNSEYSLDFGELSIHFVNPSDESEPSFIDIYINGVLLHTYPGYSDYASFSACIRNPSFVYVWRKYHKHEIDTDVFSDEFFEYLGLTDEVFRIYLHNFTFDSDIYINDKTE